MEQISTLLAELDGDTLLETDNRRIFRSELPVEMPVADLIKCACGCDKMVRHWDLNGRLNKFAKGHASFAPGFKHCNWKGGITPESLRIRNSVEMKRWRELVFKQDNYTCVTCNDSKGGNLEAHHIKPFALFPEFRFKVENGITLCTDCHRVANRVYRILFHPNLPETL